jgi:hypothetical protein
VSGRPDPSLLWAITATLTRISTSCQALGQLAHERTRAVSSLAGLPRVTRPINDSRAVVKATDDLRLARPATRHPRLVVKASDDPRLIGPVQRATREALASPTTSFVSPPAPASRDVEDEWRRGPSIGGPTTRF